VLHLLLLLLCLLPLGLQTYLACAVVIPGFYSYHGQCHLLLQPLLNPPALSKHQHLQQQLLQAKRSHLCLLLLLLPLLMQKLLLLLQPRLQVPTQQQNLLLSLLLLLLLLLLLRLVLLLVLLVLQHCLRADLDCHTAVQAVYNHQTRCHLLLQVGPQQKVPAGCQCVLLLV
jgi:hypothetical protein